MRVISSKKVSKAEEYNKAGGGTGNKAELMIMMVLKPNQQHLKQENQKNLLKEQELNSQQ